MIRASLFYVSLRLYTEITVLSSLLIGGAGVVGGWTASEEVTFTSTQGGGSSAIYTMDVNTRVLDHLIDSVRSVNPVWSPDGETLVFVRDVQQRRSIDAMDADGSEVRGLIRYGDPVGAYEFGPTGLEWSPDGTQIAFDTYTFIYLMNADGSNLRRIGKGKEPTWSPDSRQLIFMRGTSLYIMEADGSDIRLVQTGVNVFRNPVWSPDGRYVAFISSVYARVPHWDLYLVDLETQEIDRLVPTYDGQGSAFDPAWSADGQRLAFSLYYGNAPEGIYTMDIDGSDLRLLIPASETLVPTSPIWRPRQS